MNLRMGLESLTQGVMEKAVKLMSDRYTDNEKMGIGLSMALDVKDGLGAYLEVVDRLDEMNGKLLAQNRELLTELESIQKVQSLNTKCFNGICDRIDHIDNQLKFISSKKNN